MVPVAPAVSRLPKRIARKIKQMRINRRENHRLGAHHAKISRPNRLRHNVLCLSRASIVTRQLPAVNDIGIERVRRYVSVFFSTYRVPFTESDLAVVAPAGDANRTALLLTAAQSIRKCAIGVDVIKLSGRLIVPTAPGLSSVGGYYCALIAAQQNHIRVVRINPNVLIIVAARRAAKRRPGLAAVL